MQDSRYDLGGTLCNFPPFSQCFLKSVPCFPPFGTLKDVFRVLIPMYAYSWAFMDGPCSPFSMTVPVGSCLGASPSPHIYLVLGAIFVEN